jgi:hypothetical protein
MNEWMNSGELRASKHTSDYNEYVLKSLYTKRRTLSRYGAGCTGSEHDWHQELRSTRSASILWQAQQPIQSKRQ